jgi:hypothetical protein
MRRRLYFLLPDVESSKLTADDLLLARVEDRHMRFLSKRGTALDPCTRRAISTSPTWCMAPWSGLRLAA